MNLSNHIFKHSIIHYCTHHFSLCIDAEFSPQVISPVAENDNSSICIQLTGPSGGLGTGINITLFSADDSATG